MSVELKYLTCDTPDDGMKMNQAKTAEMSASAPVWLTRPSSAEGAPDGTNEITHRTSDGLKFLKVVAYPWGVEYDVSDSEEGQ